MDETKKIQEKREIREMTGEFVSAVRLTKALLDAEIPGAGDLLIDVLVEDLQKMKPGKASEPQATNGINFGLAIEAAKQGKKIARGGWNGKNQYVELASGISYKNAAGEIVNAEHEAIGNAAMAFVGTSGVQLGWLASQADMLADDWYIVEEPITFRGETTAEDSCCGQQKEEDTSE